MEFSTKISDYDYMLPEELIGQHPIEPRDHARLMVVDKATGKIEHKHFYDIIDYLNEGDIIVRNSTKVIPARLYGHKETGGIMEILLLKRIDMDTWECLLRPAKKLKLGQTISIGPSGELVAKLVEIRDDGNRVLQFSYDGIFEEVLDRLGQMPLPPYITETLTDNNSYQTVYAMRGESVAAPTAGLHFTTELLDKIKSKGIQVLDIFLTVGLGTFRPVQVEDAKDHVMHEEMYQIPEETARIVNEGKRAGKKIVSIGTTTTRALEASALVTGEVMPCTNATTNIFIYPGYKFRVVDKLITNFHLPKSTLLMLVSAFSTRDMMMNAYEQAVAEKYKFFSFGDAMYIK